MKRNLTGIFIREKVEDKWGSWDIADLPWENVKNWLTERSNDVETERQFLDNCKKKLVETLVNLFSFVDNGSDINKYWIEKNLYGDGIEQCRQCLATINMVADVFQISTKKEETLEEISDILKNLQNQVTKQLNESIQ